MGVARLPSEQKVTVEITFAVRDGRDYLLGSEVSEHLRKLSLVEFSFYIGFPVLQIAERKTHARRDADPVWHFWCFSGESLTCQLSSVINGCFSVYSFPLS